MLTTKFVKVTTVEQCVKDNDFSKATKPVNSVTNESMLMASPPNSLFENCEISEQYVANLYRSVRELYTKNFRILLERPV